MKKILPFLFPLTSLAIVMFLAFRWYSNRTDRGNITPFAENITIEELTTEDSAMALRGVGDFETVEMSNEDDSVADGQIRYEIKDGKVRFSVITNVEDSPSNSYQVWLKDPNSAAVRRAFQLTYLKGGMSGTAAIDASTLPFEVIVSMDEAGATVPSQVILRGLIEAQEAQSEE